MTVQQIHEIQIDALSDLAQLRKVTRQLMQNLQASVQEQSRVSWLTDFIGRQVLLYSEYHLITLQVVIDVQANLSGLQIECKGSWLHSQGRFYASHLFIPSLSKRDTVRYVDGGSPKLTITAWVYP